MSVGQYQDMWSKSIARTYSETGQEFTASEG